MGKKRKISSTRGRPKKPLHMRKGAMYWAGKTVGTRRRYRLQIVTTSRGGIHYLSPNLTRKEARIFAEGWNLAKGKRGKKIPRP